MFILSEKPFEVRRSIMATKHPKGLYVLFFTEMWERFGYYLMLAIFTLYLNEKLGMTEGASASLYGTYIGLVYLSPLFGGMLADRVKKIGYRGAVLCGALLMAMGYFTLALERASTFHLALGLLIIGNGLFKPNISTMVGNLYPEGDVRRDSAFSIFYMGINIGAFFSPLAASYMRSHYGWGAAFATAGGGMLIGFVIFAIFGKMVAVANQRSSVSAVLDVPLPPEYEDKPLPKHVERERIRALVIMCAIVMLFWVAFHQNGSTLTFWARDNTDRTLGGLLKHDLDPELFGTQNSSLLMLLLLTDLP
jgi:POT family proton-dependent oligopeptide transporter